MYIRNLIRQKIIDSIQILISHPVTFNDKTLTKKTRH